MPLAASRLRELAAAPAWRKLLFYTDHYFGPSHSAVTANAGAFAFFLSPHGASDPAAELQATLAAFQAPVGRTASVPGTLPDDEHALCRFPARRHWLETQLPLAQILRLPPVHCRALTAWLTAHPVRAMAIVFSSYYLNNPASLYGHTLLRLKPPGRDGGDSPPLLDEAVNFAANPTTTSPLLFALEGLFGGFPGTFSLMPYYMKVQEYSNSESRDLWEYELALTASERAQLMRVLWEVGPQSIPYYYLDQNCSFVLLQVIEAARPSLDLSTRLLTFVTPGDTVHVLQDSGLLAPPVLRASSRTRYLQRIAGLSALQRQTLERLFAGAATGRPAALAALPKDAQVIDAALDWIVYDEKLAGAKESTQYGDLTTRLLAERSLAVDDNGSVGVAPPLPAVPMPRGPERGPRSSYVGLGLGRDATASPFEEVVWRPTLHDLSSPALGYASDLQLEMVRVAVRRTTSPGGSGKPVLQSLHLFDALSVPSFGLLLHPVAWRFGLGLEREPFAGRALRSYIEGGAGVAYSLPTTRQDLPVVRAPVLTVYALPIATLGASASFAGRNFAAPGLLVGLGAEPWSGQDVPLMLAATARLSRAYSQGAPRTERRVRVQASYQWPLQYGQRLPPPTAGSAATNAAQILELGLSAETYDPQFGKKPEVALQVGTFF